MSDPAQTRPDSFRSVERRRFGSFSQCFTAALCALTAVAAAATEPGPSAPGPVWIQWYGPDGYGNGEGCFRPENNQITASGLVQTVNRRTTDCGGKSLPYATAQMSWQSFSFTYGMVSYRAKFAGGRGTWPAIWLLGTNCQPYGSGPNCHWPKRGSNEIDLTEIKINPKMHGSQPYQVPFQNAFSQQNRSVMTCIPQISDTTRNYHDYKFIWSPAGLTWFVDGNQTCSTASPQFIPTTPMFVLIDLYLGKKDGGGPIDPSTFPQSSNIRYLRICPIGTAVCDAAHATIFDDEFQPRLPAKY
jgi:beta-glucanase (GH16 family)